MESHYKKLFKVVSRPTRAGSRLIVLSAVLVVGITLLVVSASFFYTDSNVITDTSKTIIGQSNGLTDKISNLWQGSGSHANIDHEILTYPQIEDALTFKQTSDKRRSEIVKDNMEFYHDFFDKEISEPKKGTLARAPAQGADYDRANATLLVLVRNEELNQLLHTIRQIEEHWNSKFHYPYTFVNDQEFSAKFKQSVNAATSGKCNFVVIPKEIWDPPANIDMDKLFHEIDIMEEQQINYAGKLSYRNMCRFNSGYFYQLDFLKQFKWYWRFEPGTNYFCDIDYDLFKFMEENDKTYGFVISLYDAPQTVETLWPVTLDYVKKNPQFVHPNGAFKWLTENLQNPWHARATEGYSTCHFWSNFEIANMDFYRGEAYSGWIKSLEENGGFYYERWGDAPVHSVGIGLFEDKDKVHWFRDIGYEHSPYKNCPKSDKCSGCSAGDFGPGSLDDQNCMSNWIKLEMSNEQLAWY
ncbi:unnamed protein product [Kuraishia capsulata CBS 1993]|uniref:Glycosyltransferase family 15 protein n=1 Tax=Kuraishia capsulata CBS 1993 TaxID=1382522 RepID=W6MP93_9ASCO|nr:uncharacterized protein KUCA_T00004079001 [Kuraishia capsulata CBS 1993]CDK28098.1 unnamed protein product [Kuraishia capsulata CBS 1993]